MLITDHITLVAEILEEYLGDEPAGDEITDAFRPYVDGMLRTPVEIVFNTDEPPRAWRDKKRQLLRRAFAIKRGLAYEEIKDLPFRDLVKLIPSRGR